MIQEAMFRVLVEYEVDEAKGMGSRVIDLIGSEIEDHLPYVHKDDEEFQAIELRVRRVSAVALP